MARRRASSVVGRRGERVVEGWEVLLGGVKVVLVVLWLPLRRAGVEDILVACIGGEREVRRAFGEEELNVLDKRTSG